MTEEQLSQAIARAREGYRRWETEQAARPWWRRLMDALRRP